MAAVVEILQPPTTQQNFDEIGSEIGGGETNTSSPINHPGYVNAITQNSIPDFVLIVNSSLKEAVAQSACEKRRVFEDNLEVEGLILKWEISESSPELHVMKIWAPLEVLKRYSEILKLRLPMKPMKLCEGDDNSSKSSESTSLSSLKKSHALKDAMSSCWGCCLSALTIRLDPIQFPEKCKRHTGIYSRDKEYLFDVEESNVDEIFPISTRARIVQYILRRKPYKKGEELDRDAFAFGYERLIQQNIYDAGYPLHDGCLTTKGSKRKLLWDNWGKLSTILMYQPLDTVRDYFGVSIALYFAWLGYYTRMLIFAAIFGFVCFIYGIASFSTDQFVQDVCNKTTNITMCPLCDTWCGYWKLYDKCSYSKFAFLFDNDLTVLYSLFMSIWAACFLEFWKRYSAKITHRWDLSSFDLKKDFTPRPEYVAELKKMYTSGNSKESHHNRGDENEEEDEEDGKGHRTEDHEEKTKFDFELSIPFWKKRLPFSLISYSAVLLLVVLALAVLTGVIMYRVWFTIFLTKDKGNRGKDEIAWEGITVSITAAFINLTFIMLFGRVYEKIAVKLTELEFPRTQPEFEASYTLKVYLLQFINNYSSIFYVAFFKGAYAGAPDNYHKFFGSLRQEECGISCMPELCIQLAVIMIGKQSKSMIMETLIPWLRRHMKKRCRIGASKTIDTEQDSRKNSLMETVQWAKDYDLLEWGTFSLADEYLEMVLQFGFVTIFVSAFPLAPFFALLNNIFELRIDAGKLLQHYRRPVGIRVKDIGIWGDIVDGIVKLAVVSNACIIALTSNFVPKLMYRFFLLEQTNPDYGTLNGYLQHSLTTYNTNDLATKPAPGVLKRTGDSHVCYFPTYRYDYNSPQKYEFRDEHWKIWLGRVIFVILYENIVASIILFLRWIIPDVPSHLRKRMQREERLLNDFINQQELNRTHQTWSAKHVSERTSVNQFHSHHVQVKNGSADHNHKR